MDARMASMVAAVIEGNTVVPRLNGETDIEWVNRIIGPRGEGKLGKPISQTELLTQLSSIFDGTIEVAARMETDAFAHGIGFVRVTVNADGTLKHTNVDPGDVRNFGPPKPA